MTTRDDSNRARFRGRAALAAWLLLATALASLLVGGLVIADDDPPGDVPTASESQEPPEEVERDESDEQSSTTTEQAESESPADEATTEAEPSETPAEEETVEEDVPVETDTETSEEVEPPPEELASSDSVPPVEEKPAKTEEQKKHVIGATAVLMEKRSEFLFRARVDSGAKSCSLHVEEMRIEDESENMADNIGKVIRFKIQNGKEDTWLTEKIASYVIIKTSDNRERRYKVPLTLCWNGDIEKTVLVTLNNRKKMKYPLLLGRNFLRGDFLIDVEIDSDD